MKEFQQIINRCETEEFASYAQNFKARSVQELEGVVLDFQSLYTFGDHEGDRGDLISPEDWMVFSHWELCTQAKFLAYLAIKIAVLRNFPQQYNHGN